MALIAVTNFRSDRDASQEREGDQRGDRCHAQRRRRRYLKVAQPDEVFDRRGGHGRAPALIGPCRAGQPRSGSHLADSAPQLVG